MNEQAAQATMTALRRALSHRRLYGREHRLAETGRAEIVEAVINDPNGIGYVGVAYAEARKNELKIVSVKKATTDMANQPTSANIASGDYPISRYLYLYTDGTPEGPVADYIKFILSSEGQDIVSKVGYIALPQTIMSEQLAKLG